MSYIDLMTNLEWSEADLDNRMRATIASSFSEARQNELQTIMLGHIAQLRPASASEMADIIAVKNLTESAGLELVAARADMVLLRAAWAVEAATTRLATTAVQAPAADAEAGVIAAYDLDVAERAVAQAVIAAAAQPVLALVALRNPVVIEDPAVPVEPTATLPDVQP